MFKNIEISEINKKAVLESLTIPVLTLFLVLFLLVLYKGGVALLIYSLFIFLIYGAIIWVPSVLIVTVLERLVLGNRSSEKTVIVLFILEILVPLVMVSLFLSHKDLEGSLVLLGIALFGQFLRWAYLHLSGKMFNSAKKKSLSNFKSNHYGNQ